MTHLAHQEVPRTTEETSVAGKGILITGGTTGIGRAAAILLARRGANVLIFGRHEQELNDALSELPDSRDHVHGMIADVAKPADIERVFQEADRKLGQLDVLINNAALGAGSIVDDSYKEWEYVVKTNLLGYMACAHEAVHRMQKAGGGHIVNVGSMSADVREEGSSVYVATKSAIQGFSEALRKEVNKHGIKVTLIEPGSVGTDMQPETLEQQRAKEKSGEMLKAEDIAACINYCLVQPPRCDVIGVQIRPHGQSI
jgi:NADP-dependent 3-hydroxy acid dehydrogenase YdfG